MPNAYMPRETVHAWSEQIGEDAITSQASLQRLLKDHRRLTRFLEENAANLTQGSGAVTVYLFGVVARLFDLAGGRVKGSTWAQVRDAEARIGAVVGELLPVDDSFAERVRKIEWRAQPHILDEALMALFERDRDDLGPDEVALDKQESLKVFLLLWVATEVLDSNWRPAKDYKGESEYAYVHIEPTKRGA